MEYKVLALDLDGTLTNSEKKVSQRNRKAVARAIEYGVKVILASGRPLIGIEPIARELQLDRLGGYILAYNGGHIIECCSRNTIIKETIPMKYYHEICECGRRYEVNALTYNSTGILAENDNAEYVKKEGYNNSVPIIKVDNLEKAVEAPVVKFMMVGEPDKLQNAYQYLAGLYGNELGIFFSEPYFMEITPMGIEKASSLERLLRHMGIGREQLIACGDGLNDISMLKYAGLAVAMDNAYDETKKYADYITLSNEEDGVAQAVYKFILGEEMEC